MLVLSWLAMMIVHEAGHVIGARLTGGIVERVVLHPLAFSRTDVAPNPHPLVVVWSGPLLGVLLPAIAFAAASALKFQSAYLLRFFAGFCLIANGAYIGAGSFGRIGDAGVMLRHGSWAWQLWAFGAVALAAGLSLWHGLGRDFGFGTAARNASGRDAAIILAILILIIVLETCFPSR